MNFKVEVRRWSILFVLSCMIFSAVSVRADWAITQVTNNSVNESGLQIGLNGSNLLWKVRADKADYTLYFYNGTSTYTVASGTISDCHVDGNTVGYVKSDGDWEIYRWILGSTTKITNNTDADTSVKVSGSNLTWMSFYAGADLEIWLNGSLITNNTWIDEWPVISGSYVAWYTLSHPSYGNVIQFYDGSVHNLSGSGDVITTHGLSISGRKVVWLAKYGGDDREVAYYNGSSTYRLTNNAVDEYGVHNHGSNVVWTGRGGADGGTDYEIFLYNGSSTTQLTVNDEEDSYVKVNGSRVVWSWRDPSTNKNVFMLYEGGTTTQITSSDVTITSPLVSGNRLAWMQYDGDWEIFTAIYVTPTPSPTVTITPTPTLSPTSSPTLTPSISPTQTPSLTPTQSPTSTWTPTVTMTPTPQPIPAFHPAGISVLLILLSFAVFSAVRKKRNQRL